MMTRTILITITDTGGEEMAAHAQAVGIFRENIPAALRIVADCLEAQLSTGAGESDDR